MRKFTLLTKQITQREQISRFHYVPFISCSEKLFEESVLSGPVGFLTPRQGGTRIKRVASVTLNDKIM